jgi:hypothetical protein
VNCSTTVLPIIEARCDWITATGRKEGKAGVLADLAISNTRAEKDNGFEHTTWRFQGYSGFQCGEWAWGWGEHGSIVCVSGQSAEIGSRVIARSSDHFSRIDYCVTGVDAIGTTHPDIEYWRELKRRQAAKEQTPSFTRIQASDGGATFSIGQRTAAVYCRTYDKHRESGGRYERGAWRWEIELKRHRSEAEHKHVLDGMRTTEQVLALVADEYQRRHLPVPWIPTVSIQRDRCPAREMSTEKTLAWLEKCVQPAIERAVAAVGTKRVREILML